MKEFFSHLPPRPTGTPPPGRRGIEIVLINKGNLRNLSKILKEREFYLFFLQSLLMSSKVLPFVSGTQRQTKKAAVTQMIPYKLYANIGLKSYNAGNVDDTI